MQKRITEGFKSVLLFVLLVLPIVAGAILICLVLGGAGVISWRVGVIGLVTFLAIGLICYAIEAISDVISGYRHLRYVRVGYGYIWENVDSCKSSLRNDWKELALVPIKGWAAVPVAAIYGVVFWFSLIEDFADKVRLSRMAS